MSGCGPHCGHFNEIAELERLRALITAWADADEAWDPPFADDASTRFACIEAAEALRKAVGR